jgi:hypothetical protein
MTSMVQTSSSNLIAATNTATALSEMTVAYPSNGTVGAGDLTSFSPDSLLAYCQGRLGDLDSQINAAMNQQNDGIKERQSIQQAISTLGQFNPGGPQSPVNMQTCVDAVSTAIQSFPSGDPEGAQLASALQKMESDYGYQAPGSPTADQSKQRSDLEDQLNSTTNPPSPDQTVSLNKQISALQNTIDSGALTSPPTSDQWTATTSSFSNVSSDIQSQSEIGFLQMQDLVSQRQQAIELSTGLMNKVDQTLEDQAKAVGQ